MARDSARGQISRGTREARFSGGRAINDVREDITVHWLDRESDRLIVARKRDSIPHGQLLACVRMRVVDRSVLKRIRDKTRVVNLNATGASLDFLGYMFRYDRDRLGRDRTYLNVTVSKKALIRARQRLHDMTGRSRACVPVPELVQQLNRYLRGWACYFSYGYLRQPFRTINACVRERLTHHLRRHRRQRAYRPSRDGSFYAHFDRLGLHYP